MIEWKPTEQNIGQPVLKTGHNLPVPDDAPWLNLSKEEIEELRKQKHELTQYAKEKLRKMTMKTKADKVFSAFYDDPCHDPNLHLGNVLREVINQLNITHGYLDGDHGIDIIYVRDILNLIEELEKL